MIGRVVYQSVTRHVPVFPRVCAAAAAISEGNCKYRRHANARFSKHDDGGVRAAQHFVGNHLMNW